MNLKTVLRRLGTPLGGAVMLLVLWLPWADIRCGSVNAQPNLWELAEQEWKLYVFALGALLVIILGIISLVHRHRGWVVGNLLVVLMAAAAWVYLGLRHDEIVRQQIEMQQLGGDLETWLKQIELDVGRGYWLYAVGVVLAFLTSLWASVAPRSGTARSD